MHKVLLANQAELLQLIDSFEQNDELAMEVMRNIGQTGVQEAFYDELLRRAHNYLSAVKMLVDHTRNLVRDYGDHPFAIEYRDRVADLMRSGRAPLLQKLRDYLLHYRIPPFGVHIRVESDSALTSTVYMDRDAALEFKDWPLLARSYLEQQPEKVPLGTLIQEYAAELEVLYRWLYDRFFELHRQDIAGYNELLVASQGPQNTPGHPDYRPFEPPPSEGKTVVPPERRRP